MSPAAFDDLERKVPQTRRSHTKSRNGCRRCKERKIRCDERRPTCSACERRNDPCSLQFLGPSSQLHKTNGFRNVLPAPCSTELLDATEVSTIQHGLVANSTPDTFAGSPSITFDDTDLAIFRHFKRFTSVSIGDERIQKAYSGLVLEMALESPHLMHAILAISQLHGHYLKGQISLATSNPRFIRHWQQCLTQFNTHLAPRIEGDTADAMMITSTLINGIVFCMLGDHKSNLQWPLTLSEGDDLTWLNVQKGISLVFRAVAPFNESSKVGYLFGPDTDADYLDQPEVLAQDLLLLVPELAEICEITASTVALDGNAYYETLRTLAPLLQMPCNSDTIFAHLGFLPAMEQAFISLLRERDHRALLILSYWYANISSYDCWWTNIRSKVEGIAICRYLAHHADSRVLLLLRVPARVFSVSLPSQRYLDIDSGQHDTESFTPCRMM